VLQGVRNVRVTFPPSEFAKRELPSKQLTAERRADGLPPAANKQLCATVFTSAPSTGSTARPQKFECEDNARSEQRPRLRHGDTDLFTRIFQRADLFRGVSVGVRPYTTPQDCSCDICRTHQRTGGAAP